MLQVSLIMSRFILLLAAIGLTTDAFNPLTSSFSRKRLENGRVFSSTSTVVEQGIIADTYSTKEKLMDLLKAGEDDNSSKLTPYLEELYESFKTSGIDARISETPTYNGDWRNVNLPSFPGGSGFNEQGQPLYTLGRLTFNRIPNGKAVVVASEKMVQRVHPYNGPLPERIPPTLEKAIKKDPSKLLAFSIDTYFNVQDNTDLKGIIRAEGYVYPHEDFPNRFDSFFARGKCFSRTKGAYKEWNDIFGGAIGGKRQHLKQLIRNSMMRNTEKEDFMVEDKSLSYSLNGPVSAHATVAYLDDDFRVTIGQEGSRMINKRE